MAALIWTFTKSNLFQVTVKPNNNNTDHRSTSILLNLSPNRSFWIQLSLSQIAKASFKSLNVFYWSLYCQTCSVRGYFVVKMFKQTIIFLNSNRTVLCLLAGASLIKWYKVLFKFQKKEGDFLGYSLVLIKCSIGQFFPKTAKRLPPTIWQRKIKIFSLLNSEKQHSGNHPDWYFLQK